MSKKGFTLIEVLVVVAIVGILASLVVVGLGGTQARGRDAKRISDIQQVRNGLELYFSKCGYYPGGVQAATTCGAHSLVNTWAAMRTSLLGSNIGVSNIPGDDPLAAQRDYLYATDATGNNYVLGATLEAADNRALQDDLDTTINGINCADPVYCVQL